jgi:hypothetical protein
MREIKLPFGRKADGTMISIIDALRGLDCECVCPQCSIALVACKGEIVRPYFRHYADSATCEGARETALHLYAKQLITSKLRLRLPYDLGEMKSAQSEVRLPNGIQPDVLAEFASETLAIEIWVAHQVPADKTERYIENLQAALEIDLRAYRHVDEGNWDEIILNSANRAWIFPPAAVRAENHRRRQEQIKNHFMAGEEQAMAALREAEEATRREQQRLKALLDAQEREAEEHARTAWCEERADQQRLNAQEKERQAKVIRDARKLEDLRRRQHDERQKMVQLALERERTADARAALALRRKRERMPPDLQELVAAFGSYAAITPEAWAQWDTDNAAWQERHRSGFFYNAEDEELKRFAF